MKKSSILNLNMIRLYTIYKYFVQPIFINCGRVHIKYWMTCVTVIPIALIDATKCSVLALSIKKKFIVFWEGKNYNNSTLPW